MDDFDGVFTDPNGEAYQAEETRTGPPLNYVGEKLRHSLQALHTLIGDIDRLVPADLPAPGKGSGTPPPVKDTYLLTQAGYAFHYGLVSYLALHNLLALANNRHVVERLLRMSDEEFQEWLERIGTEGSVTG